MRRILTVILMLALFLPVNASGSPKKKKSGKATKSFYVKPDLSLEEMEARDSCIGKEVIFTDADFKNATLTPDEGHQRKHDLYYSCPVCKCYLRTPGRCTCSKVRVPAIRHGNAWYGVSRDIGGLLTVTEELFQGPGPAKTTAKKAGKKAGKKAAKRAKKAGGKAAKPGNP